MAHNALTNVIRHAGAGSVVISLDCTGEELRLSVSDDGVGAAGGLRDKGPRVQEHAGRCRAYGRMPGGGGRTGMGAGPP